MLMCEKQYVKLEKAVTDCGQFLEMSELQLEITQIKYGSYLINQSLEDFSYQFIRKSLFYFNRYSNC